LVIGKFPMVIGSCFAGVYGSAVRAAIENGAAAVVSPRVIVRDKIAALEVNLMTIAAPRIAEFLGLSEPELIRKALHSLLLEQKRLALQERLEILARYRAHNITELEQKIATGQVAEHPGWEDLITVENLDARIGQIDVYLRDI
jgi:hypothetical protein